MSVQTSVKPVPIGEFVAELRKFPETAFRETEAIRRFLAANPVAPETLQPYLLWNAQHYTRNLIDKTAFYELLAICWEVGQVSSVHNHRDQNCWMAVPIGKLLVENYRVVFEDSTAGKCKLETADTVEMNPSDPCAVDPKHPVHRVLNPRHFAERAVSLHVYSRPFDTCVVYSPENGTCGEIKLHFNTRFGKAVQD
jgi:predicted metal-dependent enzyme (double-stranded beta helix superfamily)